MCTSPALSCCQTDTLSVVQPGEDIQGVGWDVVALQKWLFILKQPFPWSDVWAGEGDACDLEGNVMDGKGSL